MESYDPNGLNYQYFKRGSVEGGNVQVCDQWLLDAVVKDIAIYAAKIVLDLPSPAGGATESTVVVKRGATKHFKNFCSAMDECQRLLSMPEVFPSRRSRYRFCAKVSALARLIRPFTDAKHWEKQQTDIGFSLAEELARLKLPAFPKQLPYWHPYTKQNPWNRWLENRHGDGFIPGQVWYKVVHRIPMAGLKIAQRTKFMFSTVERHYQDAGRITRVQRKSPIELITQTGENHQVLRGSVGVRWQVKDVGNFFEGSYVKYREDGADTLEAISVDIARMYGRLETVPQGNFLICWTVR